MSDWTTLAWIAVAFLAITPAGSRAVLNSWDAIVVLARRPLIAAASLGVVALLIGSLPTLLGRPPVPFVHDEFCHLLAADTFLHGRLTNPTPDMWEHFETFYEIMQPTYMSKYPPAQGLVLALGTLLRFPLLGSFGMVALGSVATYWMLLGWLPPRWSLLGGFLAATHPEIFNWGQGYWTGGVSMFAGALLGGVVTRTITKPPQNPWRLGLLAGFAIALLANHRPYEGLVTVVLLTIAFLAITRRNPRSRRSAWRMLPPVALVLIPAALWMGYYNWRITQNAFELPFNLYAKQYVVTPAFYWQRPRAIPHYRHEDIRELHVDYYYAAWLRLGTLSGFLRGTAAQLIGVLSECFNPLLLAIPAALGLFKIGTIGGNRRSALFVAAFVSIGSVFIHLATCPYLAFHYIQSAAPMFIAWIVLSLRQLFTWRVRNMAIGRGIVMAVVAAQVAALCGMMAIRVFRPTAPGETRQRLVNELNRMPGKQLVLVNYAPGSQIRTLFEWVYNDADPNQSKIVWARSMGPAKDQELLRYYSDRKLWLLDVNGTQLSFSSATLQ